MMDVRDALKGYTPGEVLGKGARSIIYSVTRQTDGGVFAAKFVPVLEKSDLGVVRHLENEYRVLRLLHEDGQDGGGIVRAIELRRVRRRFKLEAAYLILERVWGKSLAEFSDYSLPQGVHIFHQVCRALDHVHAKGFVYGDLKPHNILVEPDLHMKLVDFGFASPIGKKLRGLKGTWGYLAPEQAGGQLDVQTDVFNLGAVMYWFFTGQKIPSIVPKDRRAGGFVPVKRLKLTPASHYNPELPDELSDLIMRSCKSDLAKRPAMRQVLNALRDLELRYELAQ